MQTAPIHSDHNENIPPIHRQVLCMQAKNIIEGKDRSRTTKNKGRKHVLRGRRWKYRDWDTHHCQSEQHIIDVIHQYIPAEYIAKETPADIYILCPFHVEKTASCAIGKKCRRVKCFGCGKSYSLATFLSITLGQTQRRRERKLYDDRYANSIPSYHDSTLHNAMQLLLFTKAELLAMLDLHDILPHPTPVLHERSANSSSSLLPPSLFGEAYDIEFGVSTVCRSS